MENDELLIELQALEVELHQPACRSDLLRLKELLHDSFVEFGKGGGQYTKQTVIDLLAEEDGGLNVYSKNYVLQLVRDGMAILLYQSAHRHLDGTLSNFSNRSSCWIFENNRWQMCFHQGTPTSEFE